MCERSIPGSETRGTRVWGCQARGAHPLMLRSYICDFVTSWVGNPKNCRRRGERVTPDTPLGRRSDRSGQRSLLRPSGGPGTPSTSQAGSAPVRAYGQTARCMQVEGSDAPPPAGLSMSGPACQGAPEVSFFLWNLIQPRRRSRVQLTPPRPTARTRRGEVSPSPWPRPGRVSSYFLRR